MPFEYPYTCPEIDNQIRYAKEALHESLCDFISDFCPLLLGVERTRIADSYMDIFYNSLDSSIEEIRSTNERMRSEAEEQISELEATIDELEKTITDLESQIEDITRESHAEVDCT